MLTGEVIPVMELLSSMKSHSVPEEIDVSLYILCILNKKVALALRFSTFFSRQKPTAVVSSYKLWLVYIRFT